MIKVAIATLPTVSAVPNDIASTASTPLPTMFSASAASKTRIAPEHGRRPIASTAMPMVRQSPLACSAVTPCAWPQPQSCPCE